MWGEKKPEAPARPPVAQQPRPTVPNATFNSGEVKTMAPTDANFSSGGTARLGASLHIKGEITGNEDLQIDGSVEGLVQLEDRFGVTIPLAELDLDDLRSVASITRMVAARKAGATTVAHAASG